MISATEFEHESSTRVAEDKPRDINAANRERILEAARAAMSQVQKLVQIREAGKIEQLTVTRTSIGPLNTEHGNFHQVHFTVNDRWRDYHAIVCCRDWNKDFSPQFSPASLLVRIDSGCGTGQTYLDDTCECRKQLAVAMQQIHQAGAGVIISIPQQDGRGMGIDFKLATLILQHHLGSDTYEAATTLAGHSEIDVRTYAGAVALLKFWNISICTKVGLLTNNPEKMDIMRENGFRYVERVPLIIPATPLTERHLAAKRDKLGHLL